MLNEKDTIRCESVYSDDKIHRFILKRVWQKEKPVVCVIMLNPCSADNIITDLTTNLVVNNIVRLGKYGGVIIVNMFSAITSKLNFKEEGVEDLNHEDNDKCIIKAIEESEIVIAAWGRSVNDNRHISDRAVEVFNLLTPYEDKLYILSDGTRTGIHPLTPSLKKAWLLEKVSLTGHTKA